MSFAFELFDDEMLPWLLLAPTPAGGGGTAVAVGEKVPGAAGGQRQYPPGRYAPYKTFEQVRRAEEETLLLLLIDELDEA